MTPLLPAPLPDRPSSDGAEGGDLEERSPVELPAPGNDDEPSLPPPVVVSVLLPPLLPGVESVEEDVVTSLGPTVSLSLGQLPIAELPTLPPPVLQSVEPLPLPPYASDSLPDSVRALVPGADLQRSPISETTATATTLAWNFRFPNLGYAPSTLVEEIGGATSQLDRALAQGDTRGAIAAADALHTLQFADYLEISPQDIGPGDDLNRTTSGTATGDDESQGVGQDAVDAQAEALGEGQDLVAKVENLLSTWGERTGKTFALLYPLAFPDRLELLLVTGKGQAIRETVHETDQVKLRYLIAQLRQDLTHPFSRDTHSYRSTSQQLYRYLIAPVQSVLEAEGIDSLMIAPGPQLRSVPYSALMEGDRFLIQRYGLTLVPSFQSIESYAQLERRGQALAMGASQFSDLAPLPYADAEVGAVPQVFEQGGDAFTNEAFTEENFTNQRRQNPYQVIHLATHANFRDGGIENSYIQFWDSRLSLSNLERLNLGSPIVDLLILSACRTAVGSAEAELGFAGMTIKSGARTAIASQWEVDDAATMILMTYLYSFWNDPTVATKSEALQRAQLTLLENRVEINDQHQLVLPDGQMIPLPVAPARDGYPDLSHPYFWSSFTVIGSPW